MSMATAQEHFHSTPRLQTHVGTIEGTSFLTGLAECERKAALLTKKHDNDFGKGRKGHERWCSCFTSHCYASSESTRAESSSRLTRDVPRLFTWPGILRVSS